MALKNRLGTGVFAYEGSTIKLQSSLANLEALSEATGADGLIFLQVAKTGGDLATIFYHLQYGSEYSRDEIYAAFFGREDDCETDEWQEAFASCLADVMGKDKAKLIQAMKDANTEDAQKKTTD